MFKISCKFLLIASVFLSNTYAAQTLEELKRLEKAYPEHVHKITRDYILWKDGSRMSVQNDVRVFDWIKSIFTRPVGSISKKDLLHDNYEPIYRKMYGATASQVKKNLVVIYWMPKIYGKRYPLRVTRVNGVDQKLKRISAELEKLPASDYKYLMKPAGGFYWRRVQGQSYLSMHSFGIAMDINSTYTNYWLWDWRKSKKPLPTLTNHHRIPARIVQIFEKEGFLWGGRWRFYDTMHFEYRPELFIS